MSFVSVNHTRTALKNFVKEQMAEDDLVAIISTNGGISSLQQFTTDKRVLNSAIDRVRFMQTDGSRTAVSQWIDFELR